MVGGGGQARLEVDELKRRNIEVKRMKESMELTHMFIFLFLSFILHHIELINVLDKV